MSPSFILKGDLWVKSFFAPELVDTAPLFLALTVTVKSEFEVFSFVYVPFLPTFPYY